MTSNDRECLVQDQKVQDQKVQDQKVSNSGEVGNTQAKLEIQTGTVQNISDGRFKIVFLRYENNYKLETINST